MEPLRRVLRLPASLSLILLVSTTTASLAAASPALTEDSQCGCYLTNGTNQTTYFAHHRFFDFRSLSQYAGVPPVINDENASAGADVTSAYFNTTDWTNFWTLGSWNNSNGDRLDATVFMVNSPNNIFIESNADPSPDSQTYLTLRTQRLADFQTAAEIDSVSAKFRFVSLRMRARTVGSAGAITAMFTYRGAAKLAQVQESDLEIRTLDPHNLIHYTNQPSYTDAGDVIPQATQNGTMPQGRSWTDWAVHRMDWTPASTTWYVDDVQVAQIAFQTPKNESNIVLNAWSDGGAWAGNMTRGGAAFLQVQWLELVFNDTEVRNTGKRDGSGSTSAGCAAVCSVDETPQVGRPVMLWTTGSGSGSGSGGTNGAGRGAVVQGWVPAGVVMLLAVLLSSGLFL